MTAILGISAFYHDSAAALVVDGKIVAAAQEERFSRTKHDHRFPVEAIDYCLAEAEIGPQDLDYVGFYDKPLLKFDRILETYLAYAPRGFSSFCRALPLWLKQKLHLPRELSRGLRGKYRKRFVFPEHHESHAASAFFPSPFEEAAILTIDGVGEWATTTMGVGRGNRVELTHEIRFPHSLGLLYSAFTYFLGFKVNSGEYKVMGLAPYGEPIYSRLIFENLVDLKDDGSFRLDLRFFNYCHGLTMTNRRFSKLFGRPPRAPEAPLTQQDMDIAASIQQVTEEVMIRCARRAHEATGQVNLCMAGGVALNCVGNGRILRETGFEKLWIQPAAGDAGGALGVALLIWHQLLANERVPQRKDSQSGSLLGPEFSSSQIEVVLTEREVRYSEVRDEEDLCRFVADRIAQGDVVGWMQGRMEFGPRALGSRSILGDARDPKMQAIINQKIKFRESFRPFAPSVLADRATEFFELTPGEESPYMLLVAPVRLAKRKAPAADVESVRGLDLLACERSVIPAVTHVDYSARVQTVDCERHGRYYALLRAFEAQTGSPVVINTSFNVRGEPIVCTPEDALNCFLATDMDLVVIGDFVVRKSEQSKDRATDQRRMHLARFGRD